MSILWTAVVICIFLMSMAGFFLLNSSLRLAPLEKSKVLRSKRHKWRNEVGSLVHSTVVGLGALNCWRLYASGQLGDTSYFRQLEIFMAISAGYVVYDTVDLLQHNPVSRILGLIIHHTAVFGLYMMSYLTGHLYTLCIPVMLVDVSSVFLHVRMLLIMHGVRRRHPLRAANSLINALLFAVFRLGVIAFIFLSAMRYPGMPVIVRLVVLLFVGGLFVLNVELYRRMILRDYASKSSVSSSSSSSMSNSKLDGDILDSS